MVRRTLPRLGRLLWLGCFAFSCGASPGRPPPPKEEPLPACAVGRYLPLVDGNLFAYDAEDDVTGEGGIFVTRVRRLPGPRFSLMSSQGSHVVEVRADGIVQTEKNVYLLKAPLAPGAEWQGEGRSTVRVESIDRIVDVPAGKFVGCVETIEETRSAAKELRRRVTSTYCPDVGVALLHVEAWEGGRHVGEKATLRSFGRPVQLSGGNTP
jgi:hypothetical protein